MKAILYAPESYSRLSEAEKKKVCSGCGTKGIGAKLVPDSLFGVNITEACNIHDYMYYIGALIEEKQSADRAFLNNMVRLINAQQPRWYEYFTGGARRWKRRRLKLAKLYYEAVDVFGGIAFFKGKNGKNIYHSK